MAITSVGRPPRVTARTALLPDGKLEVALHNAAESGADGLAVIFSLRSSHPKYFSPLESTPLDGILLPGEKRTLLLSTGPECARWSRPRSDSHECNSRVDSALTELLLCDGGPGTQAQRPLDPPVKEEGETSTQNAPPSFPQQATNNSPTSAAVGGDGAPAQENGVGAVDRGDVSTTGSSCLNRHPGQGLPRRVRPSAGYREPSPLLPRRRYVYYGTESHDEEKTPITPEHLHRKREDTCPPMTSLMDPNGPLGDVDLIESPKNIAAKGSLRSNYNSSDVFLSTQNSCSAVKTYETSMDFSDFDTVSQPPFYIGVETSTNNSSQCPYFFVYYGQLGNGADYVNIAMKWLKREREKYALWRKKVLQCRRECDEDEGSLPPLLGEPVRWLKNMDGSVVHSRHSPLYRKQYSQSSAKMFANHHRGNGCVMVPYRLSHGDRASGRARSELSGAENDKDFPSANGSGTKPEAGRQAGSESMGVGPKSNGQSVSSILRPTSTATSMASLPAVGKNRLGDGMPSTGVSGEQSSLSPSPGEGPPAVVESLEQDLVDNQQPPSLATFDYPTVFHARTETEGTVEMLDHTVCGEDHRDCENQQQSKDKVQDPQPSNPEATDTSASDVLELRIPRVRRSGSVLEGLMGSFWSRYLEADSSADVVRTSLDSPLTSEKGGDRLRQGELEEKERRGACGPRRPSRFSGPRRASMRFISKVSPGSELSISQVGDALLNIAVKSAPLVQTAMDGTVSTVATTAQLFFGVIEDSIDILHAICLPVLSLFSLFLLWMALGPTGGEDGMASMMNLFA